MKPHRSPRLTFKTKLAPGKVIRFKPHFLKAIGWDAGDTLVWIVKGAGSALIFKKPTETEWRIDRLRRRRQPISIWPERCPRTLLEWRYLGVSRPFFRKPKDLRATN